MLLGEYNHSIDEKGRLIIPAKLREELGDSFVICNGLEGCLFVYSQEEWNKFVAELEYLTTDEQGCQNVQALFFRKCNMREVLTSRGECLCTYITYEKHAHLEKEVVLVGVQDQR